MVALEVSSDEDRIRHFLETNEGLFDPPLGARVAIPNYAAKLAARAINHFARGGGRDLGHAAVYANAAPDGAAFLSSICVLPEASGSGLADRLLEACCDSGRRAGLAQLRLEVGVANTRALRFYERHGFARVEQNGDRVVMSVAL